MIKHIPKIIKSLGDCLSKFSCKCHSQCCESDCISVAPKEEEKPP